MNQDTAKLYSAALDNVEVSCSVDVLFVMYHVPIASAAVLLKEAVQGTNDAPRNGAENCARMR